MAALLGASTITGCGGGGGGSAPTPTPSQPTPQPNPPAPGPAGCGLNGVDFACSGIELVTRPPTELGGVNGNDSWGWGWGWGCTEYAHIGLGNGAAFVALTTPPRIAGQLATRTESSVWRNADNAGAHGMQVFDLTRLRSAEGETFLPDHVYEEFGSAHNLAINEATGFAYAVGSDTCDEALHMIDLAQPANPLFAGCHAQGHTHDAQYVVYIGPDPDHHGSEICINSDSDHFAIVDVTTKSSSVTLSEIEYPNLGFVHQARLTKDQRFTFIGDELNELNQGLNTRTVVVDVTDLDAPTYHGDFIA